MGERQDTIDAHRMAQPLPELKRKAAKARRLRGRIWTQEDLDAATAEADILWHLLDDSPEVQR